MKSEELFEIDRQIGQIKKVFEQRQEQISDLNLPLKRVLAPTRTPEEYLQKKYSHSHIKHYQHLTEGRFDQAQKMLKSHLQQAKHKVKHHHNQLKQLDGLIKKRNVVRLLKLKDANKEKQNKKPLTSIQEPASPSQKETSKTVFDGEKSLPKMEKKQNIAQMKGDKLLQAYQQVKAKGVGGEEACGVLKRQLGMGIENTPIQGWIERRNREEKVVAKSKSTQKVYRVQRPRTQNFFKSIEGDIGPKKHIYLNNTTHFSSNFEQRLINIMRYHGNNVGITQ